MDVFDLRDQLIEDYSRFVRSFINMRDERIAVMWTMNSKTVHYGLSH